MGRNKTAKVWTLGNTTVRNPERLLGALRVFKKYFDGKGSFSSNTDLQGEFFEKILSHTESGELYIPGKSKYPPIYTYIDQVAVSMGEGDYKQKNGRLWVSPLDYFGFVSVYYDEKSHICDPGRLYILYPEMEGDIWLRQLLKFQYPNPNSEISGGTSLRPGVLLFKLILKFEGLSQFELGLTHLIRDENTSYLEGLIRDYRARRENGNINHLKAEILNKAILNHFSKQIEEKLRMIKELLPSLSYGFIQNSNQCESKLNEIVGLGKGSNTLRASRCKEEFRELIDSGIFEFEQYKNTFMDYYLLVKGDTFIKDYPDLTKRYLFMCRILQIYRPNSGEKRLRIDPRYIKIIEDSIKDIGNVLPVNDKTEEMTYLKYLWNMNLPRLPIDEPEYLISEISRIEQELDELGWNYNINDQDLENEIIDKERLRYNILVIEYYKALESKFAKSLSNTEILKNLRNLSSNLSSFDPTEIESLIWKSLLFIGGYLCHPSKTRNFHVDDLFNSIFTAAGNRSDMQFPYENLKLVVEVTKNNGKTQWRAESEPVTRHVAIETDISNTYTIGLFVAPSIHKDTANEFFRKSKGQPIIINQEGYEVYIDIVPLTFDQYRVIFENIMNEEKPVEVFLKIMKKLSKIKENSNNENDWINRINQEIEDVSNEHR